ncbi:hypothetical protein [Paenarthrobacter nitroguajacolicus]|uniref:hypothetical protein n=1 Tax=Paenarthrobacter nitroguajacolicus TaxID=211146 RepID=UPI0015BC05BE|nr:hypothetical protein [Paenarthrobacter nitroguajacolicus]NWL31476.1 hypothetical protein [Paenarthrobacter nitroguajacolicus]
MKRRHPAGIAIAISLLGASLAGCAGQQAASNELRSFSSMDEAYAAVDEILGCDSEAIGNPVVPMGDGGRLASAQRVCSENVQIDLYPNQGALDESYQTWADSSQGKIPLVRGANWMVVDLSRIAGGQSSTTDLQGLADKLKGEYAVVGT